MSKITKRKHVMKEMQTDDFDPPGPNQQIVRIIGSRGNNLHEVESAEPSTSNSNSENSGEADNADRFLVSMPTKFRKNVWVKRGDYVIVEAIDEGDKVKAEIVRILTPQHIKEFTKDGIWPDKFTVKNSNDSKRAVTDSQSDDENDNDDDLFKNTNRMHQNVESDSDDDSDEDSDDEVTRSESSDHEESD